MQTRDRKMDVVKGLLVIGMVYCHILQFFVDLGGSFLARQITFYINAVTFSGFVFTFGYTSYIAYFSKSFRESYQKILRSFLKLLGAFYISGFSYRILAERKPYFKGLAEPILLLKDIPGWSEFIISFAMLMLVSLILFVPLKKIVEHKRLFWIVTVALLFTTWIPYERVTSIHLGLFIGTTRFAAFPVLQYMPYFLLGIYFKRYEIKPDRWLALGATILTGIAVISMGMHQWAEPGRFPPTLMWIVLPALPLAIYFFIGHLIQTFELKWNWLFVLGQNSMIYLLLSNIVIFALNGVKGIRGMTIAKGFVMNLILLGAITLIIQMSRPIKGK